MPPLIMRDNDCLHLRVAVTLLLQASVVLQITFRAPRYSQAGAVQQHLLQAGLLDFLLRILPANVQLQLRLLYCCSSFQAEVEEFKPLFSMQAQGRRQPELALADQR